MLYKSYHKRSATLQREFGQQIACLSHQSKGNNISKMRNFNKDNSQLCTKCMFEQHRVICKSHLFYIIRNRPLVTKVFNLSFSNSISVESQRRIANSPYPSFQSLFDYDDYLGNFVTMLFLVTCLMAIALLHLFFSILISL